MSNTKVIVKCRISFANIWEPKSILGSEPKYSVSCLISKDDKQTLAKIDAAIKAALEIGRAKKWGGVIPNNYKNPLRDGDAERPDDANYKNMYYFNATSKDAPMIVDRQVQPILNRLDCASGDYCNVSVNFYPFDTKVMKGIAAGLGNIQKISTGEHFSGKTSAQDDFSAIEDSGELDWDFLN